MREHFSSRWSCRQSSQPVGAGRTITQPIKPVGGNREMMKIQFVPRVFALALAFLIFGAVVSAHHSAAHYSKQAMTTRGVVVEYRWRNPHVYVVWEVKSN